MKTHTDCFPCLLRQALQVARITQCSEDRQLRIVQAAASMIAGMDVQKSPPANAQPIYRKIAEITGCEDPYAEQKRLCNQQALKIIPSLRQEIRDTDDELLSVVRFAIAGNIMDYGAAEHFDIDAALERSRGAGLAVDHFGPLAEAINGLERGGRVLYLADNCGEIVYDSLLIEYLYRRGLALTVAVKEGPIINDALAQDARVAGLDRYARIISNGGRFPGTELGECSSEFVEIFQAAELVIAKGQGNFESLSEVDRDVFFLLTVKCPAAADHLVELSGVSRNMLAGRGEMAVYYSGRKK